MINLKGLINKILSIGIEADMATYTQKEIILTNAAAVILVPVAFAGLMVSYFSGAYFTSIGFALLISIMVLVFPFNYGGKTLTSRLIVSVLPQMFLLLPNVLPAISRSEGYAGVSYIFIAFVFLPLLLFQRSNLRFLIFTLLANFFIVLFNDVLLVWSEFDKVDMQVIEGNFIYFKAPQIVLWFAIVGAFQFLKHENYLSEKKLKDTNDSLQALNDEFKMQNDRIAFQNQSLIELQAQNTEKTKKFEESNNELLNTKLQLLETIDELNDTKEMLLQKEAEAKSIFEALNEHYLVAQYDLDGNLVSINTRVIELLGVLRNEQFQNIKPIINNAKNKDKKSLNGQYFNHVWKSVKEGTAQTIELEYTVGDFTKRLATTFAPLFDKDKKPYKILAIGHDVSELVEKNEKIDKINAELEEKIFEISQQNILLNFQQGEIFDKSEELHKQKQEIQEINASLEQRVLERTKVLEEKNKQLAEYAFINSHVLRAPVSTMMGLINLVQYSELPEEDRKVYEHIKQTANVLNNIVFKINDALDNGIHFNRSYLEPERDFHPMK